MERPVLSGFFLNPHHRKISEKDNFLEPGEKILSNGEIRIGSLIQTQLSDGTKRWIKFDK